MKSLFAVSVLVLCSSLSVAQSGGKIEMKETFWNKKFYQNGVEMTKPSEVLKAVEGNPEALKVFKKGKANYDAGVVFGALGGALIGWPLGGALAGSKDPQWGLAAGGAALVLIGISFDHTFSKHARKAIEIYNGTTTSRLQPQFSLKASPMSLSFVVKF